MKKSFLTTQFFNELESECKSLVPSSVSFVKVSSLYTLTYQLKTMGDLLGWEAIQSIRRAEADIVLTYGLKTKHRDILEARNELKEILNLK